MSDAPLVIAIDGPAGAGKSTVARALASRLGFFLLDTGAIYRALALTAARAGIAFSDAEPLGRLAETLPIRFDEAGQVYLGDEDVSVAIRTPEMSQGASTVSAHPPVRQALLGLQRKLAARGRCVVEGRDIGTVVLPWAPLKIFLTASPEVRARRRFDELSAKGQTVDLAKTLEEMRVRDERDSSRATAPLKQADDAVLLDSSELGEATVVDRMEALARSRFGADLP
ncbi:MAG: Cytidylate kinase [Myxococcales bacterium]|nr:Cytidylate kinase [Myxococcales bacterium]